MLNLQNSSPDIWADQVVYSWRHMGLRLNKGVEEEHIIAAEKEIGFSFDPYFKSLYRRTNGFHSEDFIEVLLIVWPLNKIVDQSKYFKEQNFIGFADFMINSAVYGIVRGTNSVFKVYDLPSQAPEKIADSFNEAILMITNQDGRLF